MSRHRRFTSKTDGLNARKRAWACKACGCIHEKKPAYCDDCGEQGLWYLASGAERQRFGELFLMQTLGQITDLKCQHRWGMRINGHDLGAYVADFVYRDQAQGRWVIEDVKPPGFRTDLSKFKIKVFEALVAKHGLSVTIVERR